MNLDRYEKIDGREALKRLADGETVYGRDSGAWMMEVNGEVIYQSKIGTCTASVKLNDFVQHKHLYVKKPFDVRQAMLDRPNEWVGAVDTADGVWRKIGFDTKYFVPVQAPFDVVGDPVFFQFERATKAALDACIPIEDVPKEATR